MTALGKTWHPEHFFCAHCGRQFGPSEGFHEKDGRAFCRDDYFELFAPKCGACERPILESFVSALGKQWHPECFNCMVSYGGNTTGRVRLTAQFQAGYLNLSVYGG